MSVFVRREARAKPGFAMGILLGRKAGGEVLVVCPRWFAPW